MDFSACRYPVLCYNTTKFYFRALEYQRSDFVIERKTEDKGATMDAILAPLREFTFFNVMLRVMLAMLMGGIVGFEREKKRRPAGFRTYMLVAIGAAMTVILSQYLDVMLHSAWLETSERVGIKTDVSRFGAQVINGIGFLGAGTIIVTGRQEVKGLTTAAALWASACMGLAIGAGFYECFIIGTALIVFSMKLLPFIEDFMLAHSRNMSVYVEMDSFENISNIVNYIKKEGIHIYDVDIEKDKHEHMARFSVMCSLRLPSRKQHTEILAKPSTLDGVIAIDEI